METKRWICGLACVGALAFGANAFAQAPAGSTAQCKDGSYTSAATKKGACAGHGGVKDWFAADAKADTAKADTKSPKKEAKAAKESKTAAAPAAAAPAAAAAATAPAKTAAAPARAAPEGMRAEAAPGGGAGKVWVNTSSKVYHCSGDEWYGKTKQGEYMTEAQAKAAGAHASHGKACG